MKIRHGMKDFFFNVLIITATPPHKYSFKNSFSGKNASFFIIDSLGFPAKISSRLDFAIKNIEPANPNS